MPKVSPKKTLYLFLAALMVFACSRLMGPVNDERRQYELTYNEPLRNAPPELELATKVLGGFRGILADVLWLRSQQMMMDSRYFEMVQLHDWISYLEPHIAEVWLYSSWNMAYNISVEMKTPEERWYWVKKGIELLRDKGIEWNQNCAELYWQLGYFYSHKIGAPVDYQHKFYKKQLALEMWDVLGDEHPDFRAFAAAPKTESGLLRDRAVRAYVKRFKDMKIDILGKDFFALLKKPDAFDEPAVELFSSEDYKQQRKAIETYLRAKRLREEFKLDPEIIVKMMYGDKNSKLELEKELKGYGELDWRLPEAHALYWGRRSLEVATGEDFAPNFDRVVLSALEYSFQRGKLIMNRDGSIFTTDWDYRFADKIDRMYDYLFKKYKGTPHDISFKQRYRNFLVDAITILYSYNLLDQARDYYEKAKKLYGKEDQDFQLTPTEFVLRKIRRRFIDNPSRRYVAGVVSGLINRGLFFLAAGDYDSAARFENMAHMIHRDYNAQKMDYESKDEEGNPERMTLPDFKQMKKIAIGRALLIFSPEMQARLKEALGITDEQAEEYRNDIREILEKQIEQLKQKQKQQSSPQKQ